MHTRQTLCRHSILLLPLRAALRFPMHYSKPISALVVLLLAGLGLAIVLNSDDGPGSRSELPLQASTEGFQGEPELEQPKFPVRLEEQEPPAPVVELASSGAGAIGSSPEDTQDRYPLPWGEDFGERPRHPDSVLDEKYRDYDMEMLKEAYDTLSPQSLAFSNDTLMDMLESPDCYIFDLDFTIDANGVKDYIGFDLVLRGDTPAWSIRSGHREDGRPFRKFAWMPYSEYEDYYLLRAEIYHIMGQHWKLRNEAYVAAGTSRGLPPSLGK